MVPFYKPPENIRKLPSFYFSRGYKIVQTMTGNGVTNPGFSKISERNQKSIARNYLHLKQGKRIHLQNI